MPSFTTYAFSGKSINAYGLELVADRLETLGYSRVPFEDSKDEPVLFSLYWPEQILDFVRLRFQMKGRRFIVGGVSATANPSLVCSFDADVYLGDGEVITNIDDDQRIVSLGNKEPRERGFCENIYPIRYEDIQDNRRTFIELSRGCKNHCLFCQYGWAKPYRECDPVDIGICVDQSKTKSIRAFAADRFQHSKYDEIRERLGKRGKLDTGSDMSIRFVLKNPDYLKFTTKVRTGVEGVSHRLRKMIGKFFSNDDLCNFLNLVWGANIRCIDFYMIYGLPTERPEDYDEFQALIMRLDEICPENANIAIHWNRFSPSPQTPFQWEACELPSWTEKKMLSLFSERKTKRLRITHRPLLTGDETFFRRILCTRAGERSKNIVWAVAKNEAIISTPIGRKKVAAEFRKCEGFDLLGQIPEEIKLPWDDYVIYKKSAMRLARDRRIEVAKNA